MKRDTEQAQLKRLVDEAFNRWFPARYGKKYRHPWKAPWKVALPEPRAKNRERD